MVIKLKKLVILLFFITLGGLLGSKNEDIIIPGNAIRFRVIANSNTLEDQQEKIIIKDKVEQEVYNLISNKTTNSDVKKVIEDNMQNITDIIDKYKVKYTINYGNNYFPAKNYKGIMYPAGNYESLVITLGEGLGDNFWCVLFPPLCLVENTKKDMSEIEYRLYVKEVLDKF